LLLVVDNGSIYTKNLVNFLTKNETKFIDQKFDQVDTSNIGQFDSFILSGRRANNQKMNAINSQIIKHAVSEKKPLLGICYGAEILALTLGGTIRKSPKSVKGEEIIIAEQENKLCQGKINAYESHNYEISQLGNHLQGLASSQSCKYEIIRHVNHDIFGTQFHPEMSDDGKSIIQNFLLV